MNSSKILLIVCMALQVILNHGQEFVPREADIEAALKFDQSLKPFLDQVRLKNKLQYGQACNFETEEARQELGKSFVNSLSSINESPSRGQVIQAAINQKILINFQSLANLRGDFCSVFDNLLCNSSSHCDCATADYEHGVRIKFIREDDTCVLAAGSPCPPQSQSISSNQSPIKYSNPLQTDLRQEAKCSRSSPCKLKTSKKFCSAENAEIEIASIMEEAQVEAIEDRAEFVHSKIQHGICTCSGILLKANIFVLVLFVGASLLSKI